MEKKDLFDYKYDLLVREMEHLQAGIRSYDPMLVTIKGWAITLTTGIIALSVNQRDNQYLLAGLVLIVVFWLIDAYLKSFQRTFIVRYNAIEHYLRKTFPTDLQKRAMTINVPDVGARVSVKDAKAKTNLWKGAFYGHTLGVYAALAVAIGITSLAIE